jgi:hypothetical protein
MLARRSQALLSPRAATLAAAVSVCALVFLVAMSAAAGTLPGGVWVLAALVVPAGAALASRAPFVFPFAVYVALVPFDLLFTTQQAGTAARLCGALSGAALTLWILRRRALVRPSGALIAWLVFAAWAALSMLWSMNPQGAAREAGTLVQVVLLYAVVSLAPLGDSDLRWVIGAVVAGGVAAACLGIHQLGHLSDAQRLIGQLSDRIPLLLGTQRLDVNEFADTLLLPLALAIVGTVRAKSLVAKAAWALVGALLLYAMALAASREAFVAAGIMLLYFIVALRERLMLLAGGAVVAAIALSGQVWQRFATASASGGSGRLSIWSTGLTAFREHWLAGAGTGSFASAYDSVYLRVFQLHDMGWSRASHDMLVQNLVQYGVIGTALLLVALALSFRAVPKLPTNHPLFGIRVALIGAMIALCVAGLFVDLSTAKVFWLGLSLLALLRNYIVGTAALAGTLAFALCMPQPASAAPRHVQTFLYYQQSFGNVNVNAKLAPAAMVKYADFIETSGFNNAAINAFKAAGGRYAVTYIDPTYVPYCVPPFAEPAGLCAGQVGDLKPSAAAWFHDARAERVRRADSYTGQYQEFLNPGSPQARGAVVEWMNRYLAKSPRLDFFFADDSGSTWHGPDGSAASGMFYGFNAVGTEIANDAAWIAGENALFDAAPRRLVLNGGDGFGPAYGGVFLRNANVAGANHEGCFNAAAGLLSDERGMWLRQANGLLADLPFARFSFCMMTGNPTPAARVYALASWWLTYDARYSVAAPIAPTDDGTTIFPEFEIVPTQPQRTARASVAELARGGIYAREFGECYQAGVPIGRCAAIVNSSARPIAMPALRVRYSRVLALDRASAVAGGRAYWRASSAADRTIGPVAAAIVRQ